MEMTEIPQVDGAAPIQNPDAQALALTGNTAVDLANVAKELGVTLDANGNVAESAPVAQPEKTVPATPPEPVTRQPQAAPVTKEAVEVPAKFQNPDGTPNVEKVEKSTAEILKGIEYYKSKEREFHQLQNKVNNPAPSQPQFQTNPAQLSPLEVKMAQDLIAEHAAQGITLDQRSAIAQARVMARGLEAKHEVERNMTEDLRREVSETRMTAELRDLIDADSELLTPAVADRVLAIKNERGYKTYREAYIQHLGEVAIAQRTGQVQTPNPTGQTAKAPPTPVRPVTRVLKTVDTSNPHAMTDDQIMAELKKINPSFRGGGSRL